MISLLPDGGRKTAAAQGLRAHRPAGEVEGLKPAERKCVFRVVEKNPYWPACPAIQPFLQLADDVCEVRERALLWFQHVDPLDPFPELSLLLEIQSITLLVALDQHAEETKQELQILFVGGSENGLMVKSRDSARHSDTSRRRCGKRLEAAANVENESEGPILLCILEQKAAQVRFSLTRSCRESRCVRPPRCGDSESRVSDCPFQVRPDTPPRCSFVFSPGRMVNRNERSRNSYSAGRVGGD